MPASPRIPKRASARVAVARRSTRVPPSCRESDDLATPSHPRRRARCQCPSHGQQPALLSGRQRLRRRPARAGIHSDSTRRLWSRPAVARMHRRPEFSTSPMQARPARRRRAPAASPGPLPTPCRAQSSPADRMPFEVPMRAYSGFQRRLPATGLLCSPSR